MEVTPATLEGSGSRIMLPLTMENYMENQMETDMAGCQNVGPFLGTLNIRCSIILRTPKGTMILTTIHT